MEWRHIPGEEPIPYEVSVDGRVKNPRRNSILKPWSYPSGHLYVSLNGKKRQVRRLVLSTFGSPQPEGQECRHKDGDPRNNRIENLEWGTRTQNIFDYIEDHGRHMNKNATPVDTARQIKEELKNGDWVWGKRTKYANTLSQKYGVSIHVIHDIQKERTFRYL